MSVSNISSILGSQGINLEQNAQQTFGAAVADFTNRNLQIAPTSGSGESSTSQNGPSGATGVWQSPKYAQDMISVAPKLRFLFKVHFYFNEPYRGDRDQSIFTFLVKSIQKPKVSYEYQAVNMYNFRTQVLTNIKHDPLTIDFHDDIGNYVHEFFNAYRRAYSPISRTATPTTAAQFEQSGMNFAFPDASTVTGGDYSAVAGQLLNGAKNVLGWIELEQFFGNGTKKNVFQFINPRIENFDFDEAMHEGGDLHSLKISFNYDSLVINTQGVTGSAKGTYGSSDIMGITPYEPFPGPTPPRVNSSPGQSAASINLFGGNGGGGGNGGSSFTGISDSIVQNALNLPPGQQSSYIQSMLPGSLNAGNGSSVLSALQNTKNNLYGGSSLLSNNIGGGISLPNLSGGLANPALSFAQNQANRTLLGVSQQVRSQASAGLNSAVNSFSNSQSPTINTSDTIDPSSTADYSNVA